VEVKKKMSNITAKTSANTFYKARLSASSHNEQLSSREGAADIMSIDRGRLYRIESGIANPYPEEIHLMADLYNAPELRNYFCKNICPIGDDIPKAEIADLDRITVRTLSAIRKLGETKELLLDITEDGVIDETEKDDMEKVLQNLEELEQIAQNMKLWVKKNFREVK
jgi:transcriptional regulator with XRE-family HTH domain